MKSFGIEEKAQTTRLTQRLLNSIPKLVISTVNKNTVVLFGDNIDELIVDYVKSPDEFYAALRKVVHPMRLEIIQQDSKFTGSFHSLNQVQSVPKTVLALASALIEGEITSSDQPSQEVLSVAQISVSQTSKSSKRRAKLKKPTRERHRKNQETPLLQYAGLKIFYTSRSHKLIYALYHVGLSVSYDWVLELTKTFYEELRQSTSYIIASFLEFLENVSSVCGLKIILMLTQKRISANQVTMGQVHLLFSFEQPILKVKNFLQSHLQATSLKIQKTGTFAY